jgi:adenine phosphoribosyltransferase
MTNTTETVQVPGLARLRQLIREIPDFPKRGILFRDITPLLADPTGLALSIEYMAKPYREVSIDRVVGVESRGFIFGTALARELSTGFVPIRKPGKLPAAVRRYEYQLEYGTDVLEIHQDALRPGERVLVVDDLLATGGTLGACCHLVRELGADVAGVVVLIELLACQGREKLENERVSSVLTY